MASTNGLNDLRIGAETAFLFSLPNLIYVYVVLYGLVPFLINGRYWYFFLLYCVWSVAGMVINFLFRYYVLLPIRDHHPPPAHPFSLTSYHEVFAMFSFVVMNTVAMFGVFIRMFKFWYLEQQQKAEAEQRRAEAEREKVRAELELLKAQLHPHFLFNTLNNLYALVLKGSDKAPDMLMRLSGILSYVLYESNAPQVPLEQEIRLCRDYVALERERYGDRLELSMNFAGEIAGREISPMLFQPFIENAFKHGTSEQLGKVWISIDLSLRDGQLFFRVINSRQPEAPTGNGLGIANVRKRLELLYPGRSSLTAYPKEDVFISTLEIDLCPSAV
ncbi:MAG TPA: histidine kinase [Dinghuibacter sp.]|uniref:sensor histidine kinase n=1 Tax=Dinghuibacter sp. TaxID=2024697 RepID=UPI002C59D244|nr:histidine kinase [Dinghuibacter sp.]HTJ11553.1 histidine kinase [Dinghuibacter sp.]